MVNAYTNIIDFLCELATNRSEPKNIHANEFNVIFGISFNYALDTDKANFRIHITINRHTMSCNKNQ